MPNITTPLPNDFFDKNEQTFDLTQISARFFILYTVGLVIPLTLAILEIDSPDFNINTTFS